MVLYGPASSHARVVVLVNGAECELAVVIPGPLSPTGYLWMSQIKSGECGAGPGAALAFTLDDAPTSETLGWVAGGVPSNVVQGLTLVPLLVSWTHRWR